MTRLVWLLEARLHRITCAACKELETMSVFKYPARYLRIVDAVCDADREWFESHPDAERYVRDAVPGEFYPKEREVRAAMGDDFVVEVVQLRPGVRGRQPVARR